MYNMWSVHMCVWLCVRFMDREPLINDFSCEHVSIMHIVRHAVYCTIIIIKYIHFMVSIEEHTHLEKYNFFSRHAWAEWSQEPLYKGTQWASCQPFCLLIQVFFMTDPGEPGVFLIPACPWHMLSIWLFFCKNNFSLLLGLILTEGRLLWYKNHKIPFRPYLALCIDITLCRQLTNTLY